MKTCTSTLVLAWAFLAGQACAQEASPAHHGRAETSLPAAARNPADTSFTVGELVVTARQMAGSTDNVVTSIDRLGPDVAQRAQVTYAWELIGRMPGVSLTNFNQGTTSGKFSFRGFNGEGEINAVKLLIDGVPSNSNDGNMPYIDQIFPLDIASIEVVRGTSDPRYGLHAIAGSANILTRTGGDYLEARTSIGSYHTYDGQVAAGIESGDFSQNYLLAYRDAGGYRDHADLERLGIGGKWFYRPSEDLSLGLIARYYRSEALEPGYLTLADARARPRSTNAYNASDGDLRRIHQLSLHLDRTVEERLDVSAKAYFNRLRDDRFVKFSATAAQQRRVTEEDHWGLSGALHYHASLAGAPLMAEAGADFQRQDNLSLRYLTANRAVTSQTRDQKFRLEVGGVYGQLILQPTPWLKVTPAWRLDWVDGGFANRLNGTRAPINDYGTISQPKLSVSVTPYEGVTLYGNWGRTFQIGLASGAYLIAPRTTNLDPSINEGWEVGVRYAPVPALETRLALWRQTATGEIKRKLNDPLGDSENVGATRRQGVDLQLSARPSARLSFWGSVSWQEGEVTTPDPATPQFRGNAIDHVPEWLWSGGVDYTGFARTRLSLWLNGQTSYWLTVANAPSQGRFGEFTVLNAEAAYRLNDRIEVILTVKNLADADYEYVWWDGSQSLHSPAEGRSATFTVKAAF